MIQPIVTTVFAFGDTIADLLSLIGTTPETARVIGMKLLTVWLMAAISWRLVSVISDRIVAKANDGDDNRLSHGEKRAETIAGLLRGGGRVVVLLIGLILSLDVFMDIGPILAGAGVLGLAISFGAQSLVKDIISGFFILFENQFDVGDVISVAGLSGGVERMTLRVVMLRDIHGTLHIVPNGQIDTVSNMTRGWSRSVLDIGVGYDADVDTAISVIKDEVKAFAEDGSWKYKLDGAPDVVGVQQLGDSAVSIRVMIRTLPGSQWEVGREFLRRAKVRLDREGIEIPFPQRTIHVKHLGPGLEDEVAEAGS